MTSRGLTYAGFAVIFAAALVLEGVAIIKPGRVTFGSIQRWLMRFLTFRILLFVFWAWLGVHLFARGSG